MFVQFKPEIQVVGLENDAVFFALRAQIFKKNKLKTSLARLVADVDGRDHRAQEKQG